MSRRSRIAVLYNAPVLPSGHPEADSEAGVVEVACAIIDVLDRSGFDAFPLIAEAPLVDCVRRLVSEAPDAVFNLAEGFDGHSHGEAHLTGILELLRIPYTGCPPESQALCIRKGWTKALLLGFGLPTARFVTTTDDSPTLPDFPGPFIVKPDAEDASLGIDQESVVADSESIERRIGHLLTRHAGPVIVESYLSGPEFNVGVLALPDPRALVVAEVCHRPRPGHWPILTYEAKWAVGSEADLASPVRCPAAIDAGLSRRLSELALAAFRVTRCRDYARVDFRLDASDDPMILEVNPNPDLGRAAGWARALQASGYDYESTLIALVHQALERGRRSLD